MDSTGRSIIFIVFFFFFADAASFLTSPVLFSYNQGQSKQTSNVWAKSLKGQKGGGIQRSNLNYTLTHGGCSEFAAELRHYLTFTFTHLISLLWVGCIWLCLHWGLKDKQHVYQTIGNGTVLAKIKNLPQLAINHHQLAIYLPAACYLFTRRLPV